MIRYKIKCLLKIEENGKNRESRIDLKSPQQKSSQLAYFYSVCTSVMVSTSLQVGISVVYFGESWLTVSPGYTLGAENVG